MPDILTTILNNIWIVILIILLIPTIEQNALQLRRFQVIKQLERKRASRVIAMIHRQERISFLGIPFRRFIDIEDSEKILRAIRLTPEDVPIDFIIHTPGGLVLAAEQIARALMRHKGKVTMFVPHYAMSGGTLLALASDEIIMDENAVLGPLDPQIGEYPATSIQVAINRKPAKEVDDRTFILADIAKKAVRQVKDTIMDILIVNGMEKEKAQKIADILTSGKWTHDYPIEFQEATKIGLPVKTGVPFEVYRLMDYYPQQDRGRPSVLYIPTPYESKIN